MRGRRCGGRREGGRFLPSGVFGSAEPGSSGTAGDVEVRASRLVVRDHGRIGSSSDGAGTAGNVRLTADTLLVEDADVRGAEHTAVLMATTMSQIAIMQGGQRGDPKVISSMRKKGAFL